MATSWTRSWVSGSKGIFLTLSSVTIFTAFCGVAVLRMMIPKKTQKIKKLKKKLGKKQKQKKLGEIFKSTSWSQSILEWTFLVYIVFLKYSVDHYGISVILVLIENNCS